MREGDIVITWKLNRLLRSLKDVLHIMERIDAAGAGFPSLTEDIDTASPVSRMMMQMVASFAGFERAMIPERTSAGLATTSTEGRIGGRRLKLNAVHRADITGNVLSWRHTAAQMARLYKVSEPTVSRLLAAHRRKAGADHVAHR